MSKESKHLKLGETEKRQLLSELANLNATQRSEFFSRFDLGKPSTNKSQFKIELESSIASGNASYLDVIQFLDEVMPGESNMCFFSMVLIDL